MAKKTLHRTAMKTTKVQKSNIFLSQIRSPLVPIHLNNTTTQFQNVKMLWWKSNSLSGTRASDNVMANLNPTVMHQLEMLIMSRKKYTLIPKKMTNPAPLHTTGMILMKVRTLKILFWMSQSVMAIFMMRHWLMMTMIMTALETTIVLMALLLIKVHLKNCCTTMETSVWVKLHQPGHHLKHYKLLLTIDTNNCNGSISHSFRNNCKWTKKKWKWK